jgi:hypothetical protein
MANYRLPVTIDLNQIPASTTPWDTGATADVYVDKRAPYQNWTLLMSSENIGHSIYQAGIAEVDHKLSRGLTLQGSYTLAKDLSDAQGSDAPTVFGSEEAYAVEIANRFDLKSDRGNVVATPRHRALVSGTYQLPYGEGRAFTGPRYANAVLGGWDVSTVTTMQSGQWLTPTTSPAFDQSNTGMAVRAGGGAILRPDCGSGNPYQTSTRGVFFNSAAFAETPAGAGHFGNCGVGILEGPDMIDVNSGLAKNVSLHERYKLRFEATFTNVLNRSNFVPPADQHQQHVHLRRVNGRSPPRPRRKSYRPSGAQAGFLSTIQISVQAGGTCLASLGVCLRLPMNYKNRSPYRPGYTCYCRSIAPEARTSAHSDKLNW